MEKRHAAREGHPAWPVPVAHRHGVRSGRMVWVGGQGDLGPDGAVRHPGDEAAQVRGAVERLGQVLAELGAGPGDLVKLVCVHVAADAAAEERVLGFLAEALPEEARPVVTLIPVPYLARPDMAVEIEGVAMREPGGAPVARTEGAAALSPVPGRFPGALRAGEMIFVAAQPPHADGRVAHPGNIVAQTRLAMRRVGEALAAFGADYGDVVKMNRWYAGHGSVEDFEPSALACAAHFEEPGPAATGIPVPAFCDPAERIRIEVIAMRGEDGARLPREHVWPDTLWDWTVHLPYKHGLRCGDMIFLGGQVSLDTGGRAVDPGDMVRQTRQAMAHIGTILAALGAGFGDVCKLVTWYAGPCGEAALAENLAVSAGHFDDPGPAATAVPLPVLAYPAMVIEIDTYAMAGGAPPAGGSAAPSTGGAG